jgi:uncharacterized membrane protein
MNDSHPIQKEAQDGSGMDALIGGVLLIGILSSVGLILVGLVWHWVVSGKLQLEYSIAGMNFFQFLWSDLGQAVSGKVQPRLLINLGIAVLMLTPFIRVLTSIFYFTFAKREFKYILFTGFVFCVLTYSLFLR